MEYLLFAAAAVLGLIYRYQLGLVSACKTVGVQISSSGTKTGFQDAITPPVSSNLMFLMWALIIALLIYAVFGFGWHTFGIAAAMFLVASLLAGVSFVPKPDSSHYVRLIYISMINRYADYVKTGDKIRADAMKELIDRVEQTFGDKIIPATR
jgi:hypothetical protein